MTALLKERAEVRKTMDARDGIEASNKTGHAERSLSTLVERVKRKSTAVDQSTMGKRRKV